MEPRREEVKDPRPRPEERPKRFRLIKLEERIAPGGSKTNAEACRPTESCTCGGGCNFSIE